jgi:Fe-S-cluster containining protein
VADSPSAPGPLDDDLVRELAAMAVDLAQRPDHADLARRLEWLVDTMILRGQLPDSFRRLLGRIGNERSTVRLAMFRDKYQVPSADIDCAARIPLCRARCCSMDVTLSAQDVAEGGIPFDVMQPYALPRDPESKRCVCMNAEGACTIYERRPGACRAYDCRHDKRVWLDFEGRVPAP